MAIGLGIAVIGHIITALIKKRSNRQSGADKDIESGTPDISLNPLANYTRFPPMTTLTTTPGHTISDMDRDIRLPFVSQQEAQDMNLEAASETPVPRIVYGP
jgi:hypothetical protein